MFRRKLQALNHVEADSFKINGENDVRNLIIWLEDQKIRHYKVEDRSALRQSNSPAWETAYKKYLDDLECPIKSGRKEEEIEWLLSFAVSLEYADNLEKYSAEIPPETAPAVASENPLDNLDFNSADFIQGVNKLASILQIDQQPDHLLTLAAVAKIVSTRLTDKALADPSSVIPKGEAFPFESADSGFSFGDPALNKAAKVLRLLYIHDLRQLQTGINECIVGVQSITANPKTDTKLGQIGR